MGTGQNEEIGVTPVGSISRATTCVDHIMKGVFFKTCKSRFSLREEN
jgi:hypothetical protein